MKRKQRTAFVTSKSSAEREDVCDLAVIEAPKNEELIPLTRLKLRLGKLRIINHKS